MLGARLGRVAGASLLVVGLMFVSSASADGTGLPVTSYQLSAQYEHGTDWYTTSPFVTLTASDGGFGVASTQYTVNGGSPQTYTAPFSFSAEGSNTVSFWSTDDNGGVESPHSFTIKLDLNDPTSWAVLSPAVRNGWFASPSVTLTGDDGTVGSGIRQITYRIDHGGQALTYTHPLSGFPTGNHTVQFQAQDVSLRLEPIQEISFLADSVAPVVYITAPLDGATYPLDKATSTKYRCAPDRQSGLESCVGTVANGARLDTSTVGMHSFTVIGTDLAGNWTTKTVHYQVAYHFSGFLNSISNTETSNLNLVHPGDLLNLGFGLNGDRGLDVFAAGSPTSEEIACPPWIQLPVRAAKPGSREGLSFVVATGRYLYGWQTSASWARTCRRFELVLNDGSATLHSADFIFSS